MVTRFTDKLAGGKVIRLWRVWLADDIVAVVAQAMRDTAMRRYFAYHRFHRQGLHDLRIAQHRETPGIADFLNDETGGRRALDGVSGATISAAAIRLASQEVGLWIKNKNLFKK